MSQKVKDFFKTYGKLGIGVYLSFSLVNYGLVYLALKEGVDFKTIGTKLGFDTAHGKWEKMETYGTPAAAYVIYKFMAPIKLPLVVGTTAWIARRGRR